MKNINYLEPTSAILFTNEDETLILMENIEIALITDGTDFDKEYSGIITYINEDGVEVNNGEMVKWEYVIEVNIING